ncbi:MAG: DUF559 domain-containing protein [Bacteroidetes bacterium]|nr:MAG: DUF559 domain-containing protein [Bacteroidota bacterium]
MKPVASKSNNYHYNAGLRDRARYLRNNSTKAEIYLWNDVLRNRWLKGFQFYRQRPVLHYIVDFVCPELMLVIEVDGVTHDFNPVQILDTRKQRDLEAVGFTVLRYSDWEVLERRDEIAQELLAWIEAWENRNDSDE